MKAVGFNRFGGPEVLETVDVPKPVVSQDKLLIRVVAAAVNPSDWRLRNGQFRFFVRRFPYVPGYDVAGVVEEAGDQVTHFRPGDAVYAMLPVGTAGGYAEYVVAREPHVAAMPPGLSFIEAASVPLTALTALQALQRKARVQPGMKVLIYGASGGVGTAAIQIAKALRCHVIGVCSTRNITIVHDLGADAILDYTQGNVFDGSAHYDVVFDTVNKVSISQARAVLRPGGHFVSVNPALANPVTALYARLRGISLSAFLVQASGDQLRTINEWIAAKQFRPIVDQVYPLADASAAHVYSETGRARGKLVLIIDDALAPTRAV